MEPCDAERTKVVANAARLLGDAKFLSENGRFGSAFALAVLGLEEIGKVILDIWAAAGPLQEGKLRRSSHLRKQLAVAALLLACKAVVAVGNDEIEGPISDELVERVAKALHDSEEGRFNTHVGLGALDKTKQLALYRDDWADAFGISADQFDQSDVTKIFDTARQAIAAVGDNKLVRVGRAVYETQVLARGGA
jgi:AbiV family abortive infection protein